MLWWLEYSSGKQRQHYIYPPTMSFRNFSDKLKRKSPSGSLPPRGAKRRSITPDQSIPTSASQSLAVSETSTQLVGPHSLYLGTSTLQLPELPIRERLLLTAGGAASPDDHSSPSSSHTPGPSFMPVSVPIIRISHEPIASANPVPPSTFTPHIPTSASHTALPQTKPTLVSSHSSTVWAKTLEITKKKLIDNGLPPLDLTNFTSQSAEENMQAFVKALNTLQKDEKKKGWSYTWKGKKVLVMEHLGKILKSMEKYSKVVDIAIQSNPQVSALVWAGIWAIMRVRISCTFFFWL